MSSRIVRTMGLVLVLVALALPAFAQGAASVDRRIATTVAHQLERRGILRAGNIMVSVQDGTVTLSGQVPSLWLKRAVIDQARGVDGVRSVVSRLTVMAPETDQGLAEQVARRLRHSVYNTIFDNVNVSATNGVVRLTGQVMSPFAKRQMGDTVRKVVGVQGVHNDLQVLPESMNDNELRLAVARRIYGNPLFSDQAILPAPPVHIIVKGSRVTLVGVVGSNALKIRAGMLARDVFGVMGVTNDLRVES